ncbi:MAG: hypothetical protein GY720_17535 [bacterium]|nr:hypothetical protein [bacterium]
MTRILQRSATAALTLAAAVLATPGIALASCVAPPPLDQAIAEAETVFVGTVVALDFDARLATFEVIEVWKGDVSTEATVNGGPSLQELASARAQGQSLFTSVDRQFGAGQTYLVVSHGRSGEIFFDNSCSSTQLVSAETELARPASAHAPSAAPEPLEATEVDTGVRWILPAIGVTVAFGIIAWVVYNRRPNPDIW